jgi:hypothetical protein
MIDLRAETLLSLREAREHPAFAKRRGGGSITYPTLWRYYAKGIRGVKLETVMCGGMRFTSSEAIARFVERLTQARDGQDAIRPMPRTPTERRRDSDQAGKRLDAKGLKSRAMTSKS